MTAGPRAGAIVAVVALAYTACGIVGMSLAIPPAQATPLFPAAGLAVAAVLRHGAPAVAGVWIGQAAMQVLRHGLAEGLPTPLLLACWGMLSVGAALQAALAVKLVHGRGPRAASGARRTRRLFGLLFLSGMIACTISATVGIGTLAVAGFVSGGDAMRAWWEWYSGDTLGVFIFAPLIVMLLERERLEWSDDLLQVLLRMGLITALIMIVFVLVRRWEARGVDVAVRDAALVRANAIAGRVAARAGDSPPGDAAEGIAREARAELAARPLPPGLRLTVLDGGEPGNPRIIFDSGPAAAGPEARRQRSLLPVPGGPWELEISAAPTFGGRGYDLSWAVALVSLVLTGILADGDLAAHAARARETEAILEKERLRRDLVIARDIQRGLLPAHETHLEGFDIAGWNEPADETGGDYYDFVPLAADLLAIGIADVTGHGIGAALVVAEVRALFRAEILNSRQLDAAVARVHQLVIDDLPAGRLVTACFAVLSTTGSLSFLSAGHGPILVRSAATRVVRMLRPQGPPIGFLPEPRYAAPVPLALEPGDVFMVLTDGFVEWRNPTDEQFGIERIEAVLAAHGHQPAAEIIARLRETVLAFAGGTRQADDLTAVVVRRPESGTGRSGDRLL